MNYTDTQLKQALARMLPHFVKTEPCIPSGIHLYWLGQEPPATCSLVLDTELLHLCWLVEESLTAAQVVSYYSELCNLLGDGNGLPQWTKVHATWQQRVIALAKVKGIEIV